MATRKELIDGIGKRYRTGNRKEKQKILEEFTLVTGYHRKHAIRALNCSGVKRVVKRRRDRIYDEAVLQALIVLWEAADRICSKRLKAALPLLIVRWSAMGILPSWRSACGPNPAGRADADRIASTHWRFDGRLPTLR